MTSQSQQTRANHLLNIIKKEKIINKFDLMDLAGISLSNYNQLSAWFKHRYIETLHMVEYDQRSKNWRWIEKEVSNDQQKL